MRILIGTVEIGGVIPTFAEGFRLLGHQATTVIKERHAFFSDLQYDVDISREALPWPEQVSGANSRAVKLARRNLNRSALLARLFPLIAQHDVFMFLWAGTSLMERNREFLLLKKLGKTIVSIFCGSDVRHSSTLGRTRRCGFPAHDCARTDVIGGITLSATLMGRLCITSPKLIDISSMLDLGFHFHTKVKRDI